ncbi:phosphatase PAP2 family protein [Aquella oligotrophica]|uniref:Phosphatidic acid phosphatase type 2/haloperoxidase domain-containing protein n=1 Tax=Aquella oligotrophica TaxID=2067065 RepID=A0A2I7N720_9NEIS|nr:phosphatase PAP2 family protein [Aquella oligotrophica]AUR52252.1 hypothetical protein CUN60_08080 [Aquella oligotrophica]
MPQKLYLAISLIILCLVTFALSPYLDQQLASLPYDYQTRYFYGEIAFWCKVIYYSVNVTTFLLILVPLAIIVLTLMKKIQVNPLIVRRMVLITYISLAIGPGLLVNTFFKDEWGRPRPYQVIRDHKPFSYPWQPHFNHPKDNSFPSGHVSIGAFIGIPFIAARRKRLGVALCIVGTIVVGIVRFLQGGHYFSDILMAAIIVWSVNLVVTLLVDKYLMRNKYGS